MVIRKGYGKAIFKRDANTTSKPGGSTPMTFLDFKPTGFVIQ